MLHSVTLNNVISSFSSLVSFIKMYLEKITIKQFIACSNTGPSTDHRAQFFFSLFGFRLCTRASECLSVSSAGRDITTFRERMRCSETSQLMKTPSSPVSRARKKVKMYVWISINALNIFSSLMLSRRQNKTGFEWGCTPLPPLPRC